MKNDPADSGGRLLGPPARIVVADILEHGFIDLAWLDRHPGAERPELSHHPALAITLGMTDDRAAAHAVIQAVVFIDGKHRRDTIVGLFAHVQQDTYRQNQFIE